MSKKERRAEEIIDDASLEQSLRMLISDNVITVKDALGVPSIEGCVELISGTIAGLPIILY